jgi:hypothetical protein
MKIVTSYKDHESFLAWVNGGEKEDLKRTAAPQMSSADGNLMNLTSPETLFTLTADLTKWETQEQIERGLLRAYKSLKLSQRSMEHRRQEIRKLLEIIVEYNRSVPGTKGKNDFQDGIPDKCVEVFAKISSALQQSLQSVTLEPQLDAEYVLSDLVRIRAKDQLEYDDYLQLMLLLTDQINAGFRRISKCIHCEKYLISYQISKPGRFCRAADGGKKSPCFIKWNNDHRNDNNEHMKSWRNKSKDPEYLRKQRQDRIAKRNSAK